MIKSIRDEGLAWIAGGLSPFGFCEHCHRPPAVARQADHQQAVQKLCIICIGNTGLHVTSNIYFGRTFRIEVERCGCMAAGVGEAMAPPEGCTVGYRRRRATTAVGSSELVTVTGSDRTPREPCLDCSAQISSRFSKWKKTNNALVERGLHVEGTDCPSRHQAAVALHGER